MAVPPAAAGGVPAAAAAAIPGEYGGDHVFMEDRDAPGNSVTIGDVIAANLQLLHLLQPALGAAIEPERVRLAGILRNALAAAGSAEVREGSTRKLQPMNQIPVNDYGVVDNLAGIRINQVPTFTGESNDPKEVVRWIRRVLTTAEAHGLTRATTINLMVHASEGSASDFIDRLREEGDNLGDVIRKLELRYGQLCSPEEALTKANMLAREEGEMLPAFLDRLRYLARMAKRGVENNDERLAAVDTVVENNIRRVLHDSVRAQLEERILARSRMGLPPFTTAELEKECIELEQKRLEKKKASGKFIAPIQGKVHQAQAVPNTSPPQRFYQTPKVRQAPRVQQTHQVQYAPAQGYWIKQVLQGTSLEENPAYDYAEQYPAEEVELEEAPLIVEDQDPGMIELVNQINYVSDRYQARGANPGPERIYQRGMERYAKRSPQGPAQAQVQQRPQQWGPPQNRNNQRPRYDTRPQARQVIAVAPAHPAAAPAHFNYGAHPAIAAGPPNRYPGNPRVSIADLLARANCVSGECIKCGQAGHLMSHDACALRGRILTDRPCNRCKKGLHGVDDCLLVFQKPAPGAVHQVQDDDWTDDDSDLNGE